MRLKDACVDAGRYGVNVSPDEYRSSGIRMLRTSDLTEDGLASDDNGVFLDGPIPPTQVLFENDLLVSRAGTIGRSYLVPRSGAGNTFAGFLIRFRPRREVNPRFLRYALRSKFTQDQIRAEAVMSTILNFNAERYANLRIPDTSGEEQRRIAEFLDDRVARIDQIITARRAQISALEEIYLAWLGRLIDGLGARHGWAPLRRFVVAIEQGWSPEADSVPALPGQPGVLKLGAVRGGSFDSGQNKAFLDGTVPREELRVLDGDLLVTRANTPGLVGDAAVAEGSDPMVYLSDLIYRLRTDRYGALLASAVLRTPRSRQMISVIARGTSGSMPKLRGEDILNLTVPNAPFQDHAVLGKEDREQRRARDERTAQLRESIHLISEYKQSLITAAVTGEIDVTTAGSGIPG